ncbi:hypothetical protein [Sulfurimonas autotrophica]|uniref:Uncharacterized protein n=1 Tax=Sulfurimonas autotrophica (strain ATCC BAA-671 / DSM 16294 / JCM 11897 / OK10) TaxID=563040 RepID=E0UQX4_SULAO|nr:hypothetical protein [Sulfurimonas autotrophica]ADN08855.1 hypothetical protein Saut_0806 [Sulfurimonas autotrophica DSM 16294]
MRIKKDIEFGWLCIAIQKITYQSFCIDGILKILWSIGLLTLIILIVAIFRVTEPALLIGAFTVLIAAFTASFSVMRSIIHSTLMEEEKRFEEIIKYKNFVLQLLCNLQDSLSNLNRELYSSLNREPLAHKTEDINQLLKRYKKTLTYLESENTLIHLDSHEIKTIFDIVEGSEKWLKTVAIYLEKPESYGNLDDEIDGYASYYLHLEDYIPEAKKLFSRELS